MRSKISSKKFQNFRAPANAIKPLMPASVFWDIENCRFPSSMFYKVKIELSISVFSKAIKGLLLKYGLFPKEIHAIGHMNCISHYSIREFTMMGINMIDVPSFKSNASDMFILTEMAKFIFSHKPPHGMVLFSGDRDFSPMVNFMDRVGYRVILVNDRSEKLPKVLSDDPAHTEKWLPLVAPRLGVRLKIPSGLRNWMGISEMRQRVSRLIGESLSKEKLLATLPSATYLCKELALKDTPMSIYLKDTRIKIQKLESILPALKFFIDKFGNKSGSIYDIPESFVKSCGYTDQFHWALVGEYYDVITLDKATSQAKVPQNVISLVSRYMTQDLDLCRFLNTAIFLKEDNLEAKIILRNIKCPEIGSLKVSSADFEHDINDNERYKNAFQQRRVVRVQNDVALILPWLQKGDPKDDRAIDQSNLLYKNADFAPLVEYILSEPSEIIDVERFQIKNSYLIGGQYKSWGQYYEQACKVFHGLKLVDPNVKGIVSEEISFTEKSKDSESPKPSISQQTTIKSITNLVPKSNNSEPNITGSENSKTVEQNDSHIEEGSKASHKETPIKDSEKPKPKALSRKSKSKNKSVAKTNDPQNTMIGGESNMIVERNDSTVQIKGASKASHKETPIKDSENPKPKGISRKTTRKSKNKSVTKTNDSQTNMILDSR